MRASPHLRLSVHQLLPLAPGVRRDYLLHRSIAPVRLGTDGEVVVLTGPNALVADLSELARAYEAPLRLEPAPADEVAQAIERLCLLSEGAHANEHDESLPERTADLRDLANGAPVVRYVNLLLREAVDAGASDIHLESHAAGVDARFRVDGVLVPAPAPPTGMEEAVISRIKLMAGRDIAERRRPQDGRIRVRLAARELDVRLSTLPTMHGESVVMRLLAHGGRAITLEELGLGADDLRVVQRLAGRAHGLLLVTGPTGSGKSTTLYAALGERDPAREKIVTVEDPVEFQLPGVTQVPVDREAGVTFASALRSILRQDPDVMMIGEMRDVETAEMAMQAAMTGHVVFSTLHTTDALGALPRLVDLGIPPYLVAATVEGIVAQRLVRRVCDDCRTAYSPRADVVAALSERPVGHRTLLRGAGCARCRGTGYRGRIGLFEVVTMTDALRDAATRGATRIALRQALEADGGGSSLRRDGWRKVEAGLTTVEEVLRVLEG